MPWEQHASGILDEEIIQAWYESFGRRYGVLSGGVGTATGADLDSDFTALETIDDANGFTSTAADAVTHDSGDANPRYDIVIWDTSAAAAAIVKGTATVENTTTQPRPPLPTIASNDIPLYVVYIPASAAVVLDANIFDRRPLLRADPLPDSLREFHFDNRHKLLHMVGAAHTNMATGDPAGLGFQLTLSGTGSAANSAVLRGGFELSTGTTATGFATLNGPSNFDETDDFSLYGRFIFEATADQESFFGLGTNQSPQDGNTRLGFRYGGSGLLTPFVDNGGAESTVTSGHTPDGSTEVRLGIEVRSGGTIVRFYEDGVQIGSDVTDNIPAFSNNAGIICGVRTLGTTDNDLNVADILGYIEA